ncbi:PXDN [Mytilus coruscus]|uniref:PXDN n=1 Tax=Mytilus coruscus TaxID=42192 RepID=A0A6J8CHG8_MYTCO|nr:PXDN [Mytilus coruscus]
MNTMTPESSATSSMFSQIVAPFCAAKNVTCDPYEKYRSYDGKCNNLRNPLWGSALTAQPRFISANYGDKYNSGSKPRKNSVRYGSLPNPRDISNTVHKEGTTFARSCLSNVAFTHFGQFVDHDVISTPIKKSKKGEAKLQCCNGNTPVNRPECLSFSTPVGEFQTTCMHFVRSETAPRTDCSPGYSDQMNQVTSYLDLSSTYGSSKKMADELVDRTTGDTRHTEVPMLNAIHTLFLREHNRIVDILKKINPHHDGSKLYNEARKILIGIYQHIIYKEFIPKLLGTTLARYHGLLPTSYGHKTRYNRNVNAGTRNGFAGAAFRIGHTFVGKFVGTLDTYYNVNEQVPLEGEFFNPRTIRSTKTFSVDKISKWMLEKFSGQSDPFVTSSVRDHLFETKPGNGFDLIALNIQRGRDHGLPSYNKFRKFCGLQPALTFGYSAIGLRDMSYEAASALQKMYRHPDDIDLFSGGLSETPVQGGLVGPTFGCLIALQFKYYRNGDRFFYENAYSNTGFTSAQLSVIKKQTMSSLYCRNFNFSEIQADAFTSARSST